MIYELNNEYYIKQGNLYCLVDVIIKRHTIVIEPTTYITTELNYEHEYTFYELKKKLIG